MGEENRIKKIKEKGKKLINSKEKERRGGGTEKKVKRKYSSLLRKYKLLRLYVMYVER